MTRFVFSITVALLATAGFTAADAAEPQVEFEVKSDRVAFAVTRDEQPVAAAKVRVFDGILVYAEAESGPDGRGECPMPPGEFFRVDIQIGDRTADRILLRKIDDHVFPSRVLLTFGLAPCCRVPSRGWAAWSQRVPASDAQADSTPSWWVVAGGAGIALFVFVTTILTRVPRWELNPNIQREQHERTS